MSLCVWWGEGGLWTHIKREEMQNLRMLLCNYEPNVAHIRSEKQYLWKDGGKLNIKY